jgi:hypothetical protein
MSEEILRDAAIAAGAGLDWLERASALLDEPDPGPTPFAVEQLLVDRAIAMIVGPPKAGKTWAALELASALVTGRDAFDTFAIGNPGPIIIVLEESGRDALHRRLDALTRGHALASERLHHFHFAANRRVRLDDDEWKQRLLDAGQWIRPRAIFLDPLARLKSAGRDEDKQKEMAPLLDFMRELREATGAAVVFVHHTGHAGTHGRGSSDIESFWETKLSVSRDDGVYKLEAEHREAEAADAFRYRLAFDETTRTVKLSPAEAQVREDERNAEVEAYLDEHPDASANEVFRAIGGNRPSVLAAVKRLKERQTTESLALPLEESPTRYPEPGYHPVPPTPGPPSASGTDDLPHPRRGWESGTTANGAGTGDSELGEQNEKRPLLGDRGYLEFVAARHSEGHLDTDEALELEQLHRRVELGLRERRRQRRELHAARSAEIDNDPELAP